MTRRAIAVLVLALAAAGATPALSATSDLFVPPAPVVRTLPNGLQVAVFEDHRLPLVQLQVLVAAGVADEPRAALGVASLTVQMLRQGTSSRTTKVFAREIERLGSNLGVSAQRDYSTVSAVFLSRDFDTGLELVADAVMNPVFTTPELETVRSQAMSAVAGSRQNPGALADDHLAAVVFGEHPYQRPLRGALETLPAVGADQVREFYRAYYRPDAARIVIAGDVAPEQAFRMVESRLGGWTGHRATATTATALPTPARRIRLVDLPGATRAEIRIGWLGPGRTSPDVPALTVVNEVLGGPGFAARVSSRAGRGALDAPPRSALSTYRSAGLLAVGASTALDSAAARVAALQAELERFAKVPVTAAELPRWTHQLVDAYPQQYESYGAMIGSWLLAAASGLPEDAAVRYPRTLADLTVADVSRATTRWLDPAHAVVVVVGPASQLQSQLERLGPVEVVSASTSPATIELRAAAITTPPTESQIVAGRAALEKAIQAHGGLTKLRSIKDSTVDGDAVLTTRGQEMSGTIHQVRKDPEHMVYVTNFFSAETYQVLSGSDGWAKLGGLTVPAEAQELDSTSVTALRFAFLADIPHLLLAGTNPGARVALRGTEIVGDRPADVIEVTLADGRRLVLFVDSQNHRLVGMEQNDGPRYTRRIYGDYRPVNGILWPYSEDRTQDGVRIMVLTLKKVEFNTGVSDDLFRKPASP